MTFHSSKSHVSTLPSPVREAFQARIAGELELPLFPETAARVMAACRDENFDLQKLADLITHDQSLAVHLLRVANSAAYAPREPIVSLQQALSRLGVTTVSEIVIAVSLKGRVFAVPGYQTRIRALWMHSAAAAAYAKEVATLLRRGVESAFLCGLLHDVGMPIAMQVLCDLVREKGSSPVPPPTMEAAMMEFHRELGTRIAQSWRLGPWIASVIRFHHDPLKAVTHQHEVLITSLADELAYWALDDTRGKDAFSAKLPQIAALNLSEQHLEALLAKRGRILEITEAFL